MHNTNPTTRIRFGVIATDSLDADLVHELFYGPDATDLSYEEAYAEAKGDAEKKFEAAREDAVIAAAENGVEPPREIDNFIDSQLEALLGTSDEIQFIEDQLEAFSDMCQIDEPVIEGTYDGVEYLISWLGGASMLWVLSGPIGSVASLCSPCVPNAADLDSGFTHNLDITDGAHPFAAYVVPQSWMAKEIA